MASDPPSRPAVFLDRDGVITPDTGGGPIEPYPEAGRAVGLLNEAGWLVVVVTNQPAVAWGRLSELDVSVQHDELARQIGKQGGRIDGFFFCPHHPRATVPEYRCICDCRKPRPGLLTRARDILGVELAASVMIGDRMTDVEAGARAGCAMTILVESGMHTQARIVTQDPPLDIEPDARVGDLKSAVTLVLARRATVR
jgi:D-glycero-D-manno-heptose 1,7-bisphosphate phosphatase